MSRIQVGFDASDIEPALEALERRIRAAAGSIGQFTIKSAEFNEQGRAVAATIEQMDSAGRKLSTTFDISALSAGRATQKIVAQAKASKEALDALAISTGAAGGGLARTAFPLPDSASVSKINSYNAAIINLQRVLGQSTISSTQVQQLFQQAASGPQAFARNLAALPPELQKVGQAIASVAAIAQQGGVTGAAAGQSFAVSWQSLLRILEVQLFRRAITGIVNAIRDGIQSSIDYQIKLQQVANVTNQTGVNFDNLRSQVRNLSDQFGQPIGEVLRASQIALTSQLGDAARGFEVLNNSMRLSQATGIELTSANKLVTTSIQAFRLGSEDSARVANTLFLAAQRTRVPLEELQNAIGRTAQFSNHLGISFEQIIALFLTISQQGGRPTEAFALLNQVLGQFERPSRQMQRFLTDLGVPTAQVAIQTFGLTGFLERLNQTVERSPEKLGELTNSVRSLRAFMALTGDQTRIFEQNLANLNANSNALSQAQQRVASSPAERTRVEFEKLRNIFNEDVGSVVINAVTRLADAMGGAKATVTGLIDAIRTLAVSFATYKLSVDVVIPVINTFGTTVTTTGGAIRAASLSMQAWAGVIGVFVLAVNAIHAAGEAAQAARVDEAARRIRDGLSATEEVNQRTRSNAQRELQEFNQALTQRYAGRLRERADALRIAQDISEAQIARHREVAQAFAQASQAFLDGLRNNLQQARSAAQQTKTDIIASRRDIQKFEEQIQDRSFNRRIQLEQNPVRNVSQIQQRIAELNEQIDAIGSNPRSSREDVQRARAIFQELSRLQEEQANRELEIQRIVRERNNDYQYENVLGQQVRVLRLDLSQIEQRSVDLVERRARFEAQVQANLQERLAKEKQDVINQQIKLRLFESQLRQLQEFRVFSDTGRFLPQFQTAESRAPGTGGRQAALAEFDRQQAALEASVRKLGGNIDDVRAIGQQRRAAILQELDGRRQVNVEAQRERDTVAEMTARQEVMNAAVQRQQQLMADIRNQSTQINALLQQFDTGLGRAFTEREITGFTNQSNPQLLQAVRTFNELKASIEAVRTAQRNLDRDGGTTRENAQALADAVARVRTAATGLSNTPIDVLRATGIDNFFRSGNLDLINRFLNPASQQNSLAAIDRVINQIQGSFTGRNGLNAVNTNIEAWRVQIQGAAGQLTQVRQGFDAIGEAVRTDGAALTSTLGLAATSAGTLSSNLAGVVSLIEQINANPIIPINPNIGGQPEQRAFGGFIGPRGTDTIPAWLSPGEFVMNAASTRRFYTQLLSMNAGVQPRYYAGGGPVTVGDIHVTVQGGETSEKTIREIGRGLNREIKRGTIRFGK